MKNLVIQFLAVMMVVACLSSTALAVDGQTLSDDDALSSILSVVCEPTHILKIGEDEFLITDTYNKLVYCVKDGETTVFAGRATVGNLYGEPIGGYFDAKSEYSFFSRPWAITTFNKGYAVSDTANNSVRYVSAAVTDTITGNGTSGSQIGTGTYATFDRPTGLATDDNGDLYVADTGNGRLCRVSHLNGQVSLILSELDEPTALCWKNGALYICESGSNRILKLQNGYTTVVAGTSIADLVDGPVEEACFVNPMGVAVSDNGTIYVSDTGNSAIRMIKDGQVTTLLEPDAEALDQYPALPTGLLWSDGLLYVCDTYANKVYTISAAY